MRIIEDMIYLICFIIITICIVVVTVKLIQPPKVYIQEWESPTGDMYYLTNDNLYLKEK